MYLTVGCRASACRRAGGKRREPALRLGLSLLDGINPTHGRCLLAHELSHLAHRAVALHDALGRARWLWHRVEQRLEGRRGLTARLVETVLKRYRPWHAAHSQVASRRNELHADACDARVTSSVAAAAALLRHVVLYDEVRPLAWDVFVRRAAAEPTPPEDALTCAARDYAAAFPAEHRDRWFRRALSVQAGDSDSHPSPAERLAALGVEPDEHVLAEAAAEVTESAAQSWLGEAAEALRAELTRPWQEQLRSDWAQWHEWFSHAAGRVAELELAAADRDLSCDERWELAEYQRQRFGREAAVATCESILAADPDHYSALNLLAELQAINGDVALLGTAQRLIGHGPRGALQACNLLTWYWRGEGCRKAAEVYAEFYGTAQDTIQAGEAERRAKPGPQEPIGDHLLAESELAAVRGKLAEYPEIRHAWLVRRVTSHLPDEPSFYLLVRPARPTSRSRLNEIVQALVDGLPLPPRSWRYVATPGHCSSALDRRVRQHPGAQIL